MTFAHCLNVLCQKIARAERALGFNSPSILDPYDNILKNIGVILTQLSCRLARLERTLKIRGGGGLPPLTPNNANILIGKLNSRADRVLRVIRRRRRKNIVVNLLEYYIVGASSLGRSYVFTFRNGIQEGLTATLIGASNFGAAVAITTDGTRAIIGASNASSAFIYVKNGDTWTEEVSLPFGAVSILYGTSVSIDGNGTRAIVGSFLDNVVFVYVRNGTTWTQEIIIPSAIPGPTASFGASTAISEDGTHIIAGAPNPGNSTFIYVRNGTTWTQELPTLLGPGGGDLGTSVSISADGTRAIVGAPGTDETFIYVRSGGLWVQEGATLSGAGGSDFGTSVSISADGTRAIVAAPTTDEAFIYVRDGSTWTLEQMLDNGGSEFADSVSITNGTNAIVGQGNFPGLGSAFLYRFEDGAWNTTPEVLVNPDSAAGDNYGFAVGSNGTGN